MKKVLAFLLALGLLFGSGASLAVAADSPGGYLDLPETLLPVQ